MNQRRATPPEDRDEQLVKLAQEIPWTPPDPGRVEEIRNVLLTLPDQQSTSKKRPLILGAAIAIAAAAAVLAMVLVREPPPLTPQFVERATVQPGKAARFVHTPGSETRPELVRLTEGTVRVEVQHLAPKERFIVATADAEVEVRGTSFDVDAASDRLEAVRVRTGLVEVRVAGAEAVLLRAGEAWQRPAPVQEAAVEEAPPPVIAAPAKIKKPRREVQVNLQVPPMPEATPPVPVAPNERAFRDAWAAFARGDMEQAAELFAEAEEADRQASLAEDACYGRAVALERAHRKHDAIAEMKRFLETYPKSVRADEVAVALGWLLLDGDDVAEAEKQFKRAVASPVSRVRRSAENGLAEVDRRRDLR